MVEFCKRLLRLSLGLDIAYGDFEEVLISLGGVYQERVVRKKHRIRIIIAAV